MQGVHVPRPVKQIPRGDLFIARVVNTHGVTWKRQWVDLSWKEGLSICRVGAGVLAAGGLPV